MKEVFLFADEESEKMFESSKMKAVLVMVEKDGTRKEVFEYDEFYMVGVKPTGGIQCAGQIQPHQGIKACIHLFGAIMDGLGKADLPVLRDALARHKLVLLIGHLRDTVEARSKVLFKKFVKDVIEDGNLSPGVLFEGLQLLKGLEGLRDGEWSKDSKTTE